MSAKNSRTLSNYVNNCVLDRKVLGEFPSKCASLFWAFLCCFLLNCFWFPAKLLERMMNNMKDQDNKTVPVIFPASDSDVSAEKQSPPEFSFTFLRHEFGNSGGNVIEVKLPKTTFTTNSNRYQFMSGKDVCGFVEEPETIGFVVGEIFLNSTDNSEINSPNVDECFGELGSHQKDFNDEFHLGEEAADDLSVTLELKEDILAENKNFTVQEEMSDGENYLLLENDDHISYQFKFVPRNSNRKDISFSTRDLKLDQENEYYYYLASFDETRPEFSPISAELCTDPIIHDGENTEIIQRNSAKTLEYFVDGDDYIEMEPYYSPDSIDANQGFKGGKLSHPMKGEHGEIEKVSVENQTLESDAANNEEEDEFDILLEHQNLVKQMKKEVKISSKLKGGLPTISEEGECAVLKDLKPLKLEEKFEYKDRLQQIRKFYKSYAEKMRKLDILNYQSLQAISFLQLKDSDKLFMRSKKASVPFVLPNFLLFKERRVYADPTLKSINDLLHRDLQVVYVGQVCLSWEILRWQYGKVIELLQLEHDDDSQGPRHQYSYNQLACEFQQFQVLLQRFVEDEPFRPPRIHNYVESRRLCRALLHVPMIKDDRREKKDKLKEQQDSISVAKLVDIVKESMQAFWEFVRADKDENHTVSKGCLAHLQVLNDDPELVINMKASLEKKERKLKMIHKGGNCIVKMFQKVPDDEQCCEMIMAQVELKIVSRVLSLSRWSTDQLRWCERKLNCINIVHRRIYMEPGFSLFPC